MNDFNAKQVVCERFGACSARDERNERERERETIREGMIVVAGVSEVSVDMVARLAMYMCSEIWNVGISFVGGKRSEIWRSTWTK